MLAPFDFDEFEGLVPALEGRPLVLTGAAERRGTARRPGDQGQPHRSAGRRGARRRGARDRRHHPHDPRPARHHAARPGADPQGHGAGQPPHVERPRRSRLHRRLVVRAAERHGGRAVVELDDLGLPLGQRARPRADRAARPHARRRRPRLRRHRHRARAPSSRRPVPSATRWPATWTASTCAGCRSSCACPALESRACGRLHGHGRGLAARRVGHVRRRRRSRAPRSRAGSHRALQQPRRHAALRVHRPRDACRRPTMGARARHRRPSAATTTRRASPGSWPWTARGSTLDTLVLDATAQLEPSTAFAATLRAGRRHRACGQPHPDGVLSRHRGRLRRRASHRP